MKKIDEGRTARVGQVPPPSTSQVKASLRCLSFSPLHSILPFSLLARPRSSTMVPARHISTTMARSSVSRPLVSPSPWMPQTTRAMGSTRCLYPSATGTRMPKLARITRCLRTLTPSSSITPMISRDLGSRSLAWPVRLLSINTLPVLSSQRIRRAT